MKSPLSPTLNRRILVIDDNEDIHADFRKILTPAVRSNAGLVAAEAVLFGETRAAQTEVVFTLDHASQGEAGLDLVVKARAAGRPYALAFVDMRMPPGWNGMETITQLWSADPQLQIVICTAYSDYSWQEIVAQVGASDRLLILKKPFDAIEVIQLAWALTAKWSLASELAKQFERLEAAVQERTCDLTATNLRLVDAISGHERSAEAQRCSEDRFRGFFETATPAIVILDDEGVIALWNPAAQYLFGWTAEEAIGQQLAMIVPEMEEDDLRVHLERMLTMDDSPQASIGLLGRHRDGSDIPMEIALATWTSGEARHYSCQMHGVVRRRGS